MLPFNPAKMFEDRRIVEYEEEETNFYYYPKGHGNEGKVRLSAATVDVRPLLLRVRSHVHMRSRGPARSRWPPSSRQR